MLTFRQLTVIQEHLLYCSYSPSFEDFSILTRESNDFRLKIMESLLITVDKGILNKADSSVPLELFWYNISGYHMFYQIKWCPSITLCVYNCHLFSFQYYITSFIFYQKQNAWALKLTPFVVFRKMYLLKRGWNPVFLWLLVLSQNTSFLKISLISSSPSEDMKKFSLNISYFH